MFFENHIFSQVFSQPKQEGKQRIAELSVHKIKSSLSYSELLPLLRPNKNVSHIFPQRTLYDTESYILHIFVTLTYFREFFVVV